MKFACRRRRQRGQALVELSIIAPVLIVLGLGTTDFGRVFGLNEAINGAAREAARQAAYYDYTIGSNPDYNDNTAILNVAKEELAAGSSVNLTYQPAPAGVNPCSSSPPASAYPSTDGTGYLYVCRSTGSDGNHVTVAILWRSSLITPISGVTGTPLLHAVVDATEQTSA